MRRTFTALAIALSLGCPVQQQLMAVLFNGPAPKAEHQLFVCQEGDDMPVCVSIAGAVDDA